MGDETYKLKAKSSVTTFEFISHGPKGAILKRVQYQETQRADYCLWHDRRFWLGPLRKKQ